MAQKLRLEVSGATVPATTVIKLEGVPIQQGVEQLNLVWDKASGARAQLTLTLGEIFIDEEVIFAGLTALKDEMSLEILEEKVLGVLHGE